VTKCAYACDTSTDAEKSWKPVLLTSGRSRTPPLVMALIAPSAPNAVAFTSPQDRSDGTRIEIFHDDHPRARH
jgi:hypothetical protein